MSDLASDGVLPMQIRLYTNAAMPNAIHAIASTRNMVDIPVNTSSIDSMIVVSDMFTLCVVVAPHILF